MMSVTSRRSVRSYAPLTPEHLARLSEIAMADHEHFTRPKGHPEYADRRLLVVLAQGAALHFVDGRNGVKDLDVWTFYARIPGRRFPAARRKVHVDFGPSNLGRQRYDFNAAQSEAEAKKWHQWNNFAGRRVDLLMRDLDVSARGTHAALTTLTAWLEAGAAHAGGSHPPSNYYLAQKAIVVIDPAKERGKIVWPKMW